MNDAWDPMDELEPLDGASLGLLASFRDAQGPSADAEARMLAGLRARIDAESSADDSAAAATLDDAPAQEAHAARGNVRTLAVAAVAFAAGVVLTVSLERGRQTTGDAEGASPSVVERIVYRDGPSHAGAEAQQPHVPTVHLRGGAESPQSAAVDADNPAPPWVRTLTEPASAEREPTGDGPRAVDEAEPTTAESHSTAIDEPRSASDPRRPNRERPRENAMSPSAPPTGRTGHPAPPPRAGAWAPSITPTPSMGGVSSVARNPALGGASPQRPPIPAPSNPSNPAPNQDASPDGGTPPAPGNDEPSPEPAPSEPDQPDDLPDDDLPDDEPEDEVSLEELCEEEFQACSADADAYCAWNMEGCGYAFEFCNIRHESCLGYEPQIPFPHPDEPDPHDPYDCYADYEVCIAETAAMCEFEKAPEEECDVMWWQCEEMLTTCEGGSPW